MITRARVIVAEEWERIVKEFELRPGSVSETVVSRIINRLDEEVQEETELGKVYHIEHDGFIGEVIGVYKTREGRRGCVLQQIHPVSRVVHVYSKKYLGVPQQEKKGEVDA